MFSEADILNQVARLRTEIAQQDATALERFPFAFYAAYLRDVQSDAALVVSLSHHFRRDQRYRRICRDWDSAILNRFNQLAMAELLSDARDRLARRGFSTAIHNLYETWFERIFDDLSRQPLSYFQFDGLSPFRFDWSVCCLKTVPIGGANVVHFRRAGMPALWGGGPAQFYRYLRCLIFTAGGFSPFCVIHTHARFATMADPSRLEDGYLRIAELLQRDTTLRGLYRRGWMLDPAVGKISPHLACLRQVPLENGAEFFPCRTTKHDLRHSLTRSPLRQRLYESGTYRPSAAAFIWPRQAMLSWAAGKGAR